MHRLPVLLAALAAVATLACCSTARESFPPRTATEQLLISSAADHMVDKLKPQIPPGTKVFVDAQYFEGLDSKYTISAIRDRVLRAGAVMVADRKDADMVVEIRAGAHSIDQHAFLIGIPSFTIPVPLSGSFTFPEIALFKRGVENGVVKTGVTAYNNKTGALDFSLDPVVGRSARTEWVVLLLISWTTTDLVPPDAAKDDADSK